MDWRGILFSALAGIAALVLLIFMRPVSEWFAGFFIDPPQIEKTVVGELQELDGIVEIRTDSTPWQKARTNDELLHGQYVRVGSGGHILMRMSSQHTLGIKGPAELIVERWNPGQTNSPYLISMVRGDLNLQAPGKPGQLFVAQNKKVFAIEAKPAATDPRTVDIVPKSDLSPLEITPATNASYERAPPRKETKAQIGQKMPEKIREDDALSNKYIESMLGTLAGDFRRCQMNSLRDQRPAKGSLLLSLTILSTGKVNNVYVLQNNGLDPLLVDCSVSVIGRAKFRSFEGLPISLSYPIDYQ